MDKVLKTGWSKPAAILFASENPAHEKAFAVALAEAAEFGAELILFHSFDSIDVAASASTGKSSNDYAQARAEKQPFEALAQRAKNLGIHCKIVVRPGQAAEQILSFIAEQKIDRIVMGAHSPGPIGKLLVGSVAEEVLRNSVVPVSIVGREVVESAYRNCSDRTILCSVDAHASNQVVIKFAADLAVKRRANFVVQQVIPPQECEAILDGRSLGQMEDELMGLVPNDAMAKVNVKTRVVVGDPTEELLYQSRALKANLIVLGAQGASQFAAISRAGVVYKVLAFANCPVVTLSPVLLAECGGAKDKPRTSEISLAGVF